MLLSYDEHRQPVVGSAENPWRAVVKVGFAGSTQNAGKLRTRGSGEADEGWTFGKHHPHSQRQERDVNATESDSEELRDIIRKLRPRLLRCGSAHILDTLPIASPNYLAAKEPYITRRVDSRG